MEYWTNDLCLQAIDDNLLLGGFLPSKEILRAKQLIYGKNQAILL